MYCADKQTCKNIAATLIRDMGFDPIDAGPLRMARYTEPFAVLVAKLPYGGKGVPELAQGPIAGGAEPSARRHPNNLSGQHLNLV